MHWVSISIKICKKIGFTNEVIFYILLMWACSLHVKYVSQIRLPQCKSLAFSFACLAICNFLNMWLSLNPTVAKSRRILKMISKAHSNNNAWLSEFISLMLSFVYPLHYLIENASAKKAKQMLKMAIWILISNNGGWTQSHRLY